MEIHLGVSISVRHAVEMPPRPGNLFRCRLKDTFWALVSFLRHETPGRSSEGAGQQPDLSGGQ